MKKMMTVEEAARWMRGERQRRGWSTAELAIETRKAAAKRGRLLKLSQQAISSFENENAKNLPSWLTDVALAFEGVTQDTPPPRVQEGSDEAVLIAELPTYVGAGGGGTGEGEVGGVSFSRGLIERDLRADPSDLLSVTIEGNSMSPDFLSGDRLLIDKRKQSLAQPGAFCFWDGDGYVVKYVERVPGSEPPKIRVISRNETFSTFERLVDEVRILGRVVWFARRV